MSNNDHFTRQIIIAALDAAAQEMFDVIKRTAMSPIIYEVLDVGTGVTDCQGNLVSSGAGIPSFIGVLDKSVKAIIEKHHNHILKGDIFITNDPNYGGVTHLNDVVLAQPVFVETQLVAWVASIAHWGDIGGKVPGSMPVDVEDIFAEGLRLPNIKLASKGVLNPAIIEIIKSNSRLPDYVEGDLKAQIAASIRAERLITDTVLRYGRRTFDLALLDTFHDAELKTLAGLNQLPKGDFQLRQEQDNGSVFHVKISILEDQFVVDLTDNPKEMRAPHNTSRDGAVIACQMFFKALTDPSRTANFGSFKCLKVLTKPGTIFDANDMLPHGYYFETRIQLIDLLWQCMAKAMPGRLPAGHFASIFGTVIAGRHPDHGRNYTMVEPQMGGWGATSTRNGMDAMFSTSHGDTFNCPVEIAEARYGLEILEKSLNAIQDKAGYHSGGRGLTIIYQLRHEAMLSVGMSHARLPVWSSGGVPNGGINSLTVQTPEGAQQQYAYCSGLNLDKGSKITIKSANGGYAPIALRV